MTKLRIKAPDGKTLVINAGDDPSQYDSIVDDVMKDYTGTRTPKHPIPSNEINEPGLIDIGVGGLSQPDLTKAGEEIATSKFGQKHPILGATVGTVVSDPLAFIGAAQGLASVPEAAELVKSIPSATKNIFEAVKGFPGIKQTIKWKGIPSAEEAVAQGEKTLSEYALKPKVVETVSEAGKSKLQTIQDKITQFRQEKVGLPGEQVTQTGALESARAKAGTRMGEIESEHSVALTKIPPEISDIKRFTNKMGKIKGMTPEEIKNKMEPKIVQELRKQAQIAAKDKSLPSEWKALIQGGREQLAKTMDLTLGTDYESARSAWQVADDAIDALPGEIKIKGSELGKKIINLQNESKQAQKDLGKLMSQAKKSDTADLLKIKDQIAEIKLAAAKKAALISKLKSAGIAAAGITGAGVYIKHLFK